MAPCKENRMQWVDAMRGFSMLIVVLGHVLLSMGIGGYGSFLSSVLLTFRMPLFFFVSGFFSYRLIEWWNRERILDILKRKCQAQVLCTILFLSVYQYVTGGMDFSTGFGGYWFTIVLFQMYIIYLLFSLAGRFFRRDIVIPSLVIISIVFVGVLVLYSRDAWIWNFLCWENLTKYMQYFTLGLICARYRERFFSILSNNVFIMTMVVGWILCMLLWYSNTFKSGMPFLYSIVHDTIVRYCALLTVIVMFFSNKDRFSQNTALSRTLGLIGRRTLDIYMIHYFLLPDLSVLTDWLTTGNMVIPQLIVSAFVTAVIVAVCLLISSILRKSEIMEAWLFGVKRKISG